MADPLIAVRELAAHAGATSILHDVSFSLSGGEVVTLFGPSGAGKTTVAMSVAGIARPGVTVTGQIASTARIGYLPQHAAETLNPARRIGRALGELAGLRNPGEGRARRRARVVEVLRAVAFDVDGSDGADLARLLRRYPFEFSGGQRTRLALAQVLVTCPDVLVLDEPTTGLDALSTTSLVDGLGTLALGGVALLVVTHDSDVVARLGGRVLRVHDGTVSAGNAAPPRSAAPASTGVRPQGAPVVRMREVSVRYGRTPVLREVNLELFDGETLGVVGASGAGKSTVARCLAGLLEPGRGTVLLDEKPLPTLRKRTTEQIAQVQYVWQEAASSFDRRRTALDQVAATAIRLRGLGPDEARREATELLTELGLTGAQLRRYPPALSGGQLQRAAVARALLARPRVLICDEVTTGLDQPLSDRILDHMDTYQRRSGASVLLISHDRHALAERADRIVAVENAQVRAINDPFGSGPVPGRSPITARRIP
ncbi:ABC transporter ATP-binding protein [Prauserella cavernicola]|uniref:ABC transporter ATP-binding protein n=1 Tax=Prauserella cavernicola TaxID=2800127 RepID=A0A934QVY9_9PSEU|nr:ATP-binding cassette domain-containing protein [Prauserella cavernicola]MBK1787202.1 ABC transporter ATP-binding protein [Prauserella cavernicola]